MPDEPCLDRAGRESHLRRLLTQGVRSGRESCWSRRAATAFVVGVVTASGLAAVAHSGSASAAGSEANSEAGGEVLVHYDMTREGSLLTDVSGNGHDATLVGLDGSDFSVADGDAVLTFDEDGYVELPDFVGDHESLVVELTFRPGGTSNEGLFSIGTSGDADYVRFHPRVDGNAMWEAKHDGRYDKLQQPFTYPEAGWTTAMAVMKSSGTMDTYLDGVLQGSVPTGGSAPSFVPSTGDVLGYLGRPVYGGDPYFSGALTDLKVSVFEEPAEPESTSTRVVSTTFPTRSQGSSWWRSAMITGNGHNGALVVGNPSDDTLIYQNTSFVMPSNNPRDTPVISQYLQGVRQTVMDGGVPRPTPQWQMYWDYAFHPGHELNLDTKASGPVTGSYRWTDYETGEVGVDYTDERGSWERRTFASRADDVVVTHLTSSSTGAPIDLDVDITPIDDMSVEGGSIDGGLRYRQVAAADGSWLGQVAHYPDHANSELREGGFAGITYVVTKGGTKERYERTEQVGSRAVPDSHYLGVSVRDAEEVFLVTKSERDTDMGPWSSFDNQTEFAVVDELVADLEEVVERPAYQVADGVDYAKLLAPHVALHGAEFNAATLQMEGAASDEVLTNERLILAQQQDSNELNPAMIERSYNAGRYATISSSGYASPRLGGMWIGAWNPAWQADWTLDANVNLQIAGANIGAMNSEIAGYANLILRLAPDWETNASSIYGMSDAVLAPPRTDGDRGSLYHFSEDGGAYPFQYWNAGASWLLYPLFEQWQTYGDVDVALPSDVDLADLASVLSPTSKDLTSAQLQAIEERGHLRLVEDLLLPLLTKQSNFWQQLADPRYYQDANGDPHYSAGKSALSGDEKYLLLPCYSPENWPKDAQSPIAMNCSMDIAAAREGLQMTLAAERYVNGDSTPAIATWNELLADLPPVTYDETGALREWSSPQYTEQHAHRHVSQAYFAWPAHESQDDSVIAAGLARTLELRKATAGDKSSGHGWLHIGLVDARLKNATGTTEALRALLTGSAYYSSFTTNHNVTGDSAYASDILNTVPSLMLESLIYSNPGKVQVLPAVPDGMEAGTLRGSMVRTQARVDDLTWDLDAETASVTMTSNVAQTIELSSGREWRRAVIDGYRVVSNTGTDLSLALESGQSVTVEFTLGEPASTPSSTTIAASFNPARAGNWLGAGTTMALTTTGVPVGGTTQYRVGSGPWTSYVSAVALAEGVYDIAWRVLAADGSVLAGDGREVKVDTTAPRVSATAHGRRITLAANDAGSGIGSGIKRIDYRANDGGWVIYTRPVTIPASARTVTYRATDLAGNSSAVQILRISLSAPHATSRPRIVGTPRVGAVLKARPGRWDVPVRASFRWLRDGKVIRGADGARYRLRRADLGARISVRVVAHATGRPAGSATSSKTSRVRHAHSRSTNGE